MAPAVDEYDPDNLQKGEVYGESYLQIDWCNKCQEKVREYKEKTKLKSNKKGYVFNKNIVYGVNEEFELKNSKRKVTITNVSFNEMIGEKYLNQSNMFVDVENIKNHLDSDGDFLEHSVKWIEDDREWEEDNEKLYWVVIDVDVKGESEWVDNTQITPEMEFLYDDGEAVRLYEKDYVMDKEWSEFAGQEADLIYLDLDLYDFSDPNQCYMTYPTRKGDEVKFQIGYIVPEDMLDYAYLWYQFPISEKEDDKYAEDYYTNIYDVLVKIK